MACLFVEVSYIPSAFTVGVSQATSPLEVSVGLVCSVGDVDVAISWSKDSLTFTNDDLGQVQYNTLTSSGPWHIKGDSVEGYIIEPTSGSSGTHMVGIGIKEVNEGTDKVTQIIGVCGNAQDSFTIVHEGQRESFILSDGAFILADGQTFNVIKA